LRLRAIIALAFLVQPLARLRGRLSYGLVPWRRLPLDRFGLPRPRSLAVWSERWRDPHDRLLALEQRLSERGAVSSRGGVHDRWDLAVRGGLLGGALMRTLVEEHGRGRQLARARLWPRWSRALLVVLVVLALVAAEAASDGSWLAAGLLFVLSVLLAGRAAQESGAAVAVATDTFERSAGEPASVAQPRAAEPPGALAEGEAVGQAAEVV
jgi:hypothetical protein